MFRKQVSKGKEVRKRDNWQNPKSESKHEQTEQNKSSTTVVAFKTIWQRSAAVWAGVYNEWG